MLSPYSYYKTTSIRMKNEIHLLPCEIQYNGAANVGRYFHMTVSKEGACVSNVKPVSFRSRFAWGFISRTEVIRQDDLYKN